MTYTVRIPGKTQPVQMELAALKNAYADRNVPGSALVTLAHQDFWYSVAELMGDKPTRPLLFPCPKCKQMIRSRMIDRGNPVTCARCQASSVVPNPRTMQASTAAAVAKRTGRPFFIAGLVTTLIGAGMIVYPYVDPSPDVRSSHVSFVIIAFGIAMMAGRKFGPGIAPHDR